MAQYALDADPMVDSLLPWVAARVASASTGSEVQQALAVAPPSVSVRTLPLEVFAVPGNVGEERKLGEMVMLRPGMAEKEGLLPGQLAQVSFGPGEATTTLIPTCTSHVSLPPLFLRCRRAAASARRRRPHLAPPPVALCYARLRR